MFIKVRYNVDINHFGEVISMKVVIVDDEVLAIKVLEEQLKGFSNVDVIGIYTNPLEALANIKMLKPDVLFLDINMGSYSGIELAPIFIDAVKDLNVVFVTGLKEHAVEAFELGAVDYLLKPANSKRVASTIEAIFSRMGNRLEDNLKIQSFGSFSLLNDNEVIKWRTRKAKELFVYLWIHQDITVSRDALLEIIFPGEDFRLSSGLLSTTLYQMKKAIEPVMSDDMVMYLNDGYRIKTNIKSDYRVINEIISSSDYSLEKYLEIKKLYHGPFLQEEAYEWSRRFTYEIDSGIKRYLLDFISLKNDELTSLMLEEIYLFVYKIDPIDENVALLIMEFYYENNLLNKGRAFYEHHERIMLDMVDAKPLSKLRDLYNIALI